MQWLASHTLSITHTSDMRYGTCISLKESVKRTLDLVENAIVLDGSLAEAHGIFDFIY
jgi:hypothetical protein